MPEPLVLFDVDGTLCDTCLVDARCFRQALSEGLGTALPELDWADAPQVTDHGIIRWFWSCVQGRDPSSAEITGVMKRMVDLLEEAWEADPSQFNPLRGSPALVDTLQGMGWNVAVASGGGRIPATFKLRGAGLDDALLLASSDDSEERARIFALAAMRAGGARNVILVGDGVWDVKVARQLGWSFVGVGTGRRAALLQADGARRILPDFADERAVVEALRNADPPEGAIQMGQYRRQEACFVPWDPESPLLAEALALLIRVHEPLVRVEHVGSSAVPGCGGKGLLDLAILYPSGALEEARNILDLLGFQSQQGSHAFPEGRPMRVGEVTWKGQSHRIHAHVLLDGCPEHREMLVFRDRLRSDPGLRNAYMARKQEILAEGITDSLEYCEAKGAFVRGVLAFWG